MQVVLNQNIWDLDLSKWGICITTNGVLDSRYHLVMGAGIALEAKQRFPSLPEYFGRMVKQHGNNVYYWPSILDQVSIFSFPTKHHRKDKSSLSLIRQSCEQLVSVSSRYLGKSTPIAIPAPGCNHVGLLWDQVEPTLNEVLSESKYHVFRKV